MIETSNDDPGQDQIVESGSLMVRGMYRVCWDSFLMVRYGYGKCLTKIFLPSLPAHEEDETVESRKQTRVQELRTK